MFPVRQQSCSMKKMENVINYKKQPLYYVNANKKVYFKDVLNKLEKARVKKGDIIFVQSDISVFGKIGEIKDKNIFLDLLLEAFKEAVGKNGTIIMPTFTYSFCKNEPYEKDYTPSTVGVFTEYFRKQKNVTRTNDPIFSVATYGKLKSFFVSDLGKDCFGKNSIFDKLYQKNAKIILFGTTESTFIHYIEQRCNVPYRFYKSFSGKIINRGKISNAKYDYFVRSLDGSVELDLANLNKHLIDKKIMKKVGLGSGNILSVESRVLFFEGMGALRKNPYFFFKNNKK